MSMQETVGTDSTELKLVEMLAGTHASPLILQAFLQVFNAQSVSLGTYCCAATLQAPHVATWCWDVAAIGWGEGRHLHFGQAQSEWWLPPARSWETSPGEQALARAKKVLVVALPRVCACHESTCWSQAAMQIKKAWVTGRCTVSWQ